jgi:flagellar assembly protein FliH
MTSSFKNVPPPAGGAAKPSYARFIPREEVQSFEAWKPGAIHGRRETDKPGTPPPPTPEQQQAALQAARQQGYQDGYRDGLVALEGFKQSFAAQMTSQLGALLGSFDAQFAALEAKMAQALAQAATQLARQVVRSELATNPELIAGVAREALANLLLSARHVTVHVHPDDMPLVAQGAAEEIERRGARLVASSNVARGGCIVESDVGGIDADIETRWRRAAATLGDDRPLGLGAAAGVLTLRDEDSEGAAE